VQMGFVLFVASHPSTLLFLTQGIRISSPAHGVSIFRTEVWVLMPNDWPDAMTSKKYGEVFSNARRKRRLYCQTASLACLHASLR
jgi:hypothetical protein